MAETSGAKVVSLDLNDDTETLASDVASKAKIDDKPAENTDVDGMYSTLSILARDQFQSKKVPRVPVFAFQRDLPFFACGPQKLPRLKFHAFMHMIIVQMYCVNKKISASRSPVLFV